MQIPQSKTNRSVDYHPGIKVIPATSTTPSKSPKPISKKLNPQLLQRIIAKSVVGPDQRLINNGNSIINNTGTNQKKSISFQNQAFTQQSSSYKPSSNLQISKQVSLPPVHLIRKSDFGYITPRSQISEREVSLLNALRQKASYLIAINDQSPQQQFKQEQVEKKLAPTAAYNFQSIKRRLISQFRQNSYNYMKQEVFNQTLEDYISQLMLKQSDDRIDELDRYKKQLKECVDKNSILTKKLQEFQKDTTNKAELNKKLKNFTNENKALEQRLAALDKVLKQQNDSFKQSQEKANQQIQYLNTQLKSSHTKQFNKLNENNKQIIQQNIRLKQQIQYLQQQIKSQKIQMQKVMKDLQNTRSILLQQVNQLMKTKLAIENKKGSSIRQRDSILNYHQNSDMRMQSMGAPQNYYPSYSSKALSPISSQGHMSSPKQVYQDTLIKMSKNLEQVIDLSSNKIFRILLDDDSITLQPQDLDQLQKLYPGMSRQQIIELRDKICAKSLEQKRFRQIKNVGEMQLRRGKQIVFEQEEEQEQEAGGDDDDDVGGNNIKIKNQRQNSSTPELKALRDKLIKLKVQSEVRSMKQKMERQKIQQQENNKMMMLMNKKGLEIEIQSPSDFSNYGTAKQTDQQNKAQKQNKNNIGQTFPFYPVMVNQGQKRYAKPPNIKQITLTSQSANQNDFTSHQPQSINISSQDDFLRRLQQNYGGMKQDDLEYRQGKHTNLITCNLDSEYDSNDNNNEDELNKAFDQDIKEYQPVNLASQNENLYPHQIHSERQGQYQKRQDLQIAQTKNQFRKGLGLNSDDFDSKNDIYTMDNRNSGIDLKRELQKQQKKKSAIGYQQIQIDFEEEGDNMPDQQ